MIILPETYNGSDSIVTVDTRASQQYMGAQTTFMWVVPKATTPQYYFSNGTATASNGLRFAVSSSNTWLFGTDSGTAFAPSNDTASNPTLNALNKVCATWDGSITGANINLWLGIDSGDMLVNVSGAPTNGS